MKKLKVDKNNLVVYIFFFLISFCKGIGLSNASQIYLVIYLIGVILATIKLFKIGFNQREILLLGSIFIIGVLDFILGKETTILFTSITLIFLKNTNLKNVIKTLFIGRVFGFLLMIFMPLIGMIEMNTLNFYRAGEFITRYAFGYSHPNLAHSTFDIIVIMWLYLYNTKINLVNIATLEILNYILYKYTASRTGFLLLAIFLLIAYILKKKENFQKKLPKYLNIVFILLILCSILFAIGYGKVSIVNKLDVVLTGRIKYMSILINNYLPPIIKSKSYAGILFDNGYFDLIYNGGLLASIWFICMQIKTNNIIKKKNLYNEALLSLMFFVCSITESYYVSSLMNVSILFIAYALYGPSKNINKEKECDKVFI